MNQKNDVHDRLVIFACLLGYGTLFFLTARPGPPLLYDEPTYLEPIGLLREHGLSLTFVREYPQPAGLLHNVMHWALEPVTGLKPPVIRLVNPVLLVLTSFCAFLTLRLMAGKSPISSSLTLIGIPMIWVLAGMVLTEMPAILLGSLSTYFLLLARRLQASRRVMALLIAFLGGVLLGLAFMSRAQIIVILFATPFLIQTDWSRTTQTVISFACGAAILPIALCYCWGGLVPPKSAVQVSPVAFSLDNMVLSFCYASAAMIILAPRYFAFRVSVILAIVSMATTLNLLFGLIEVNAARSVIQRLPAFVVSIWPRLVGGGLVALAVLFAASTMKNLYRQRHNSTWLFLCMAMVLLVASTGKITHQFSSRYTGLASGIMVLVGDPYSPPTAGKSLRLAAGMFIGFLILLSYYATVP